MRRVALDHGVLPRIDSAVARERPCSGYRRLPGLGRVAKTNSGSKEATDDRSDDEPVRARSWRRRPTRPTYHLRRFIETHVLP